MATVTTGQIAKALRPGVERFWGIGYDEKGQEWSDVFDVNSSKMAYEEQVQMIGTGLAPVKGDGASISYDTFKQGFTQRYTHTTYALGLVITREAIEDNQYQNQTMRQARMLGFSMKQTKENVGANILNRGFNSAYAGGDGVELFSAVHPLQGGGTFANELAVAADLSESALEDLCILIDQAVDDRGLKIAISGQCLIVPPALQFDAHRILMSAGQSGTANNDINAMGSMGMLPGGVKVNHYLTDPDAFYIKTSANDGLQMFQRRKASAPEQDKDFDSESVRFKVSERYVFGWTDPRGAYASPGA